MNITNAIKHFKLICTHKYYVFKYCYKAGLAIPGIKHDLSKFCPAEFGESVKYYNGSESPISVAKRTQGVSYAWLHHKGRNPHHYEYWQDDFDHGGKPIQMPFKYALEAICDYLGAGKAYMGTNFSYSAEYAWWQERFQNPLAMHPQTKCFINLMLRTMAIENSDDVLRKERAILIYRTAHYLQNSDIHR